MTPKKKGKTKRKRQKSSGQNNSGEIPYKRQSNTRPSPSNVNKPTTILNNSEAIVAAESSMSQFNAPVVDPPMMHQNRQQYQPMTQTFPNPNFIQNSPTSPIVGYYPSNPQNIQPVMQSSFNQGPDTNFKLDTLVQRVDEIFNKLSTLDSLNEKLI